MRFWLFALILVLSAHADEEIGLIPSRPDQIAALSSEPNFLIGGCIHPLSGTLALHVTDLVANGAQPIELSRIYCPPSILPPHYETGEIEQYYGEREHYANLFKNYRGWIFLPHRQMERHRDLVKLPDKNGAIYTFVHDRLNSIYGISNVSGDRPSGAFDPRNIRFIHNDRKTLVSLPDGTMRVYASGVGPIFHLEKEILPNGKILKYSYKNSQLDGIVSFDPLEKMLYASLHFEGDSYPHYFHFKDRTKKHPCGKFHFDDGEYEFTARAVPHFTISQAVTQSGQMANFSYELRNPARDLHKKCGHFRYEFYFPPFLTHPSTPFYRMETVGYQNQFLLESYSGIRSVFRCAFNGSTQIESLLFPVKENGDFIRVHTMHYDPPEPGVKNGATRVSHADGTNTVYNYSMNFLLSSIQRFDKDGSLKMEKVYSWDDNQWLRSIEWKDGKGSLFYIRTFKNYDEYGNPGLEIFSGDLTGSGIIDSFSIKRTYSNDNRNLLLSEETDEGLVTMFCYLPGTNLIESKWTLEKEKILVREFYQYDNCFNLISKSVDDGSSEDPNDLDHVTERRVTTYVLRQEPTYLHMPKWIEERCLDLGVMRLIKKTKLSYDKNGNVDQEEVYGSDGNLAYAIYREYDEQGHVVSETNPLGFERHSTFDAQGHLKETWNFSGRLKTERSYDAAGRLKSTMEIGDKNWVHSTSYQYDPLNRLIEERDPFDLSTQYVYDLIAQKPLSVKSPSVVSSDGRAVDVVKAASYDALGRPLTEIDAKGNVTKYRYNAYGSPTEILYPNGAKETFRYYKNGRLRQHLDRESLLTEYHYDILGRVVEKRFGQIATETFSYSSFHLKAHKDKEDHLTTYTYDAAGRKIEENRAGRIVQFSYDPLGQLAMKTIQNGTNALCIHYERDFLDRVIEERKTDLCGNLLYKIGYEYDPDGNRQSLIHHPNNQPATTAFHYDPFGRLTETKDPLGNISTTIYDETKSNVLGQRILTKRHIDPNGISTVSTYDPYGRETSKTISTLRTEKRFYDPAGNLFLVNEKGRLTRYNYNSANLPAEIIRAYGSPDARTTSYAYTPSGHLQTKKMANGLTLTYGYDPFGHRISIDSSDGTLSHTFRYSPNGHLLEAKDKDHTIVRTCDPFGNTLTEIVDGKYLIIKTHDALDRLLSVMLPDRSSIHYSYNPLFLKTVERYSFLEKALFSQRYEFDLSGRLISETLPYDLGIAIHTYDAKGRLSTLSSPYFSQTLTYDPGSRIIGIDDETFSYDDLSELTQEPSHNYTYDDRYNRISTDDMPQPHNALDELATPHDLNGNLTEKNGFALIYDPLNRLIEAQSADILITHTYDPLGRRLSRTVNEQTEFYLYDGMDELGSLHPNGILKDLRITGHRGIPIAVELESQLFIALADHRGDIRRLIDPTTQTPTQSLDYTAYGVETTPFVQPYNPWRYSSKRFDPELNLSYFGHRYYDAQYGRWITTDPAGFIDGMNLYQYVLNNPLMYVDPDGRLLFALPFLFWGAECVFASWTAVGISVAAGVATGAIAYAGYELVKTLNEKGYPSMGDYYYGDLTPSTYDCYSQKHTPDQEALSDLVKGSGKKGISNTDADTLLDWAKEYDFPARDDRGKDHWVGGEHIHIGPKHVPVRD